MSKFRFFLDILVFTIFTIFYKKYNIVTPLRILSLDSILSTFCSSRRPVEWTVCHMFSNVCLGDAIMTFRTNEFNLGVETKTLVKFYSNEDWGVSVGIPRCHQIYLFVEE
ncbi:hypothetical protein BpHYR1_008853 [Brachionus plicatilis]|uniref:Uncharacterized protein n=1 Tax=Brachionus plicatilis TaxID=10195 RepID=A0A3M7ST00_BRAPC|nr:hypothetical protein BpHYR1_008853 [Brachionus plicatilis]